MTSKGAVSVNPGGPPGTVLVDQCWWYSCMARRLSPCLRGAEIELAPASFSQHLPPSCRRHHHTKSRGASPPRRLLLTPCGATTTSWATGNARLCVCPGAARHALAFVHYRHRGRDESALPPVMSFACSLLVTLTLERADTSCKARWPLGRDTRASLLSRRRY